MRVAASSRRKAMGLIAAAPLSACARPTAGSTKLRFWAMGREGEVVQALLPAFERANPGISVSVQQLPWSAAHEKLLTAFAGDDLPDVGQIGNTWLPEFVALGAVDRLDEAVSASPDIRAGDYFAGIWATNVVGGGLYGIPWYVDTRLLFYRPDLLARAGQGAAPVTWAQWLAAMRAIKAGAGPGQFAALLPLNEYEPLLALALQQSDPLITPEGRGNFRSPGFERALRFYADIFALGLAPVATDSEIANVWSEFGAGRFAFYISGPWNIGEFKRRLPASQQGAWMTAPLPGPGGPGASIAGGSSLVVFNRSRHKAAAWRLIEHLSAPEVQARFHALTGDLPPRRSAWSAPGLAGDIYARAFRDQLERVKPVPKIPEWERIATEMGLVAEEVVRRGLAIDRAAAELDRRADAILEKHRWMLARGRA